MQQAIVTNNAGLVLLNSYLPMLFDRLQLTQDHKFLLETNRAAAFYYLQYLACGLVNKNEADFNLSKILCGMVMNEPLPGYFDITEANKQLMEGLLKAAIGYWPAIGDTSVDGFRGNWLIRDGKISEEEEKYELIVEKRAYDVLINHSPFSFSIIKYPWMEKPLHVSWPY